MCSICVVKSILNVWKWTFLEMVLVKICFSLLYYRSLLRYVLIKNVIMKYGSDCLHCY